MIETKVLDQSTGLFPGTTLNEIRIPFFEDNKAFRFGGGAVQIGFYIPNSKSGHSVVVVGYAEYAKYLRLFCLDPSWGMSCSAFWNNIIDINLDNSAEIMMDYEHMAERYVLVTEILLINEELDIVDSPLPF